MELAYCGLKCDECPVYTASVSKNTEEQSRLAKEYSTDDYQFSKEDMVCFGCHSEFTSKKMCGDCEIRKCGVERAGKNCAECTEFPCSLLEEQLGGSSDGLNRLKQLAAADRQAEG